MDKRSFSLKFPFYFYLLRYIFFLPYFRFHKEILHLLRVKLNEKGPFF
jgi:hypothetical protein